MKKQSKNKKKPGRPPSGKDWRTPVSVLFENIEIDAIDNVRRGRGIDSRSDFVRKTVIEQDEIAREIKRLEEKK